MTTVTRRLQSAILVCIIILGAMPSLGIAENKSGLKPQVLKLPNGPGSVEGLGESFEPQLGTGTARYSVKLEVPQGINGFQPSLTIHYDGGMGNSILGLGWSLSLPAIQRQTDKGLPQYQDDRDRFFYQGDAGDELVPLGNGVYRLKNEGLFSRFIFKNDSWEVWEKDGGRQLLGSSESSRQTNPHGIFRWCVDTMLDRNGNEIHFSYMHADGQIYIDTIRYTIIGSSAFNTIRFLYEDRPDTPVDYKSRSRVKTSKRLRYIDIYHQSERIRRYGFEYEDRLVFSVLKKITKFSGDGVNQLPSLQFTYSADLPLLITTVVMLNPPPVCLTNPNADLIDINGDALPDIVHTPHEDQDKSHRFLLNAGRGSWAMNASVAAPSPIYFLDTIGVQMADMDGDGLSDLLVKTSDQFGFFKNRGGLYWEDTDYQQCGPFPGFTMEDPNVRMVDLNHDGLTDILQTTSRAQNTIWLNGKNCQWITDIQKPNVGVQFVDSRLKFGDMNGDGLEDLVYLYEWGPAYFPSKGMGEFDAEIQMTGPSIYNQYLNDDGFQLCDINNDGYCDILYVASGELFIWLNTSHDSFTEAIYSNQTPQFNPPYTAIRIADMDGDGLKDILISDSTAALENQYRYIRINADNHPNLLTQIDNGLGQLIDISYKSSTEYMLDARDQGKPWQTVLPFPVHVVSRKTVTDKNSGQHYITSYSYRDGFYDGIEKEFRGFAEVTQMAYGDDTAPTLKTVTRFDVGKSEESRKGMVLEQIVCTDTGDPETHVGVFQKVTYQLDTKTLAEGTNGDNVRFSFTAKEDTALYEQTATPRLLRIVRQVDDYGNETGNFNYGEISGNDLAHGDDDILTTTIFDYRIDDTHWMLDLPSRITQTRLSGAFVSDTKHFYDDLGNLIRQEKSPNGIDWIAVVQNEYDSYGNIIKMTDANNHSRSIQYDAITHTFPISETIDDLNLSVFAAYDTGFGKIVSFTDYNGHLTRFGYDAFGRLISIVKPGDSMDLPTQSFEYHLSDPVSFIKTSLREVSGQPETYDAFAYVDGLGRKLQTRSEGENGLWVVSDAMTFNQKGKENRKWLPYFGTTSGYAPPDPDQPAIDLAYDATDRVVRETNPDGSFKSTVYFPLVTETWDEEDNTEGDHQGTPIRLVYDGQNRLVRVEERNGKDVYTTRYAYDGLDNLIRIVDDHGNVKTMSFDGLGRKTDMNDPDKGRMTYRYDHVGNLIQTTDNKNQVVSYTYDAANRIVSESYDGIQVQYHYDRDVPLGDDVCNNTLGRLVWVKDEAGEEIFSYTPRGNIENKTRRTMGYEFRRSMTYDAMDRMTSLTYPDGMKVTYLYNSMNQLESIPGYVTAIDYHPSAQKNRFVYANGVVSEYQYDNRYRMTGLHSMIGGRVLQDLSYAYDFVSNILSISDGRKNPTPENLTRQFVYDDLYRLTEAVAPTWTIQYGYDSIGNLVQQTSDVVDDKVNLGALTYGEGTAGPHAVTRAGSYVYGYDGNGNLSTKTGQRFHFDYRDRLKSTERDADGVKAQYRYDYGGNRVIKNVTQGVDSQTTIYIDQFSEVRKNRLIHHVYAGDRRVARISRPFDLELFLADAPQLTFEDFDADQDGVISIEEIRARGDDPDLMEVAEVRDALRIYKEKLAAEPEALAFGVMAAAVHELNGNEGPVEPEIVYYLPDHLGSAAMMVDGQGNVVEESVFYPYGMERAREGGFSAEYKFTGKELDGENDLHYFGARYYDAMVGRFVSVDPLIYDAYQLGTHHINTKIQPNNTYRYVDNNPINFKDYNGLFKFSVGPIDIDPIEVFSKVGEKALDKISKGNGSYFKCFSGMQKAAVAAIEGRPVEALYQVVKTLFEASASALKSVVAKKAIDDIDVLKGTVENGIAELNERGYGINDLKSAFSNIPGLVKYGIDNPDALIQAGIEGVTSATAVTINTVAKITTIGMVDKVVTGKQIQKGTEHFVDWYITH